MTSAEASFWASETSVLATAAAGMHSLLMVHMTILQLSSHISKTSTYDAVGLVGALQGGGNLPLSLYSSAQGIMVLGAAALGISDPTAGSRVAGTTACRTEWTSDSSIRGMCVTVSCFVSLFCVVQVVRVTS